jgi:wee1-like protein kinase
MDIKPENIYITSQGRYKIGDMGLVSSTLNRDNLSEGDARYLAPELLGDTEKIQLEKCDIFALGATLYELARQSPLPPNGTEWHEIRNGKLQNMPSFSEQFVSLLKVSVL